MAGLGALLASWGPTIAKNLPYIIGGGVELYRVYRTTRSSNDEKKAVDDAMELIKEHRGDIDRLMEDRKQMMTMLQGLSVMMERLTQHYGSPGIGHFHSPHNCCQHAAAPPCCHHDHGPREGPGCHHHGAREQCAGRDPRGPPHLHRGQRGPPHPGSRRRDPKGHSGCPCSSHPELPQCQESSDDEDYGAASSEPPSSWRVCSVCYNNYNMSRRRPTILMCGHTFCRQCLEEITARGPLRCPTCNAYERRPTAALPSNVVLMVALEQERPSRESGAENTTSDGEEKAWKKNSTLLQEDEELQVQRALQLSMRESEAENAWADREEDNWKKTSTFLEEEEELQMQTALQHSMREAEGCQKTSTFLQEEEESQMQAALHLSLSQSGAESDGDDDHGKKSSDLLQEEMLTQLAIQLSLESE